MLSRRGDGMKQILDNDKSITEFIASFGYLAEAISSLIYSHSHGYMILSNSDNTIEVAWGHNDRLYMYHSGILGNIERIDAYTEHQRIEELLRPYILPVLTYEDVMEIIAPYNIPVDAVIGIIRNNRAGYILLSGRDASTHLLWYKWRHRLYFALETHNDKVDIDFISVHLDLRIAYHILCTAREKEYKRLKQIRSANNEKDI